MSLGKALKMDGLSGGKIDLLGGSAGLSSWLHPSQTTKRLWDSQEKGKMNCSPPAGRWGLSY